MKKNVKVWLSLMLAMALVLTACGQGEKKESAKESTASAPASEEARAESKEEKAEAGEFKVDPKLKGTTLKVMQAYGGAEKAFEKFSEITGIKVEPLSMSTGKALAQFQAAKGVTGADVWFGGGVDSYLSAKDLGYLMQYSSPQAANVEDSFKDKDGYWTSLALVPTGFLVNKDVLKEKGLEAPKTWEDLAKPEYKGEIIMATPGISGTQYAIVNGLLQKLGEEKGWDYWKCVNANIDQYAQGGGEPGKKVSAGEFGIGVLAVTGGTYELEKKYPVQVVMPTDSIPWTPAPIAIFHDAKNVEAAKVMVDFFLSKEGQEILKEADGRIMANKDVKPAEVLKDVDTSLLLKQDVSLFGSQREDILKKWDQMLGK